MNLDLISLTVTAPGAGGTAMAAVTGDSLQIRNARPGSDILALAVWSNAQGAGSTTIIYPSGHDQIRDIRYRNIALQPDLKSGRRFPPHFKPQESLTVTQVGSATAGDVETCHLLLWYEDFPGADGQLINNARLHARGVNRLTIEDTTTATATGAYSGQRAINAASDLLKANTDYAIIGGCVQANCGALAIAIPDNGNFRCGFPGLSQDGNVTGEFFADLSEDHGVPCIPVFNSGNKGAVLITNVTNELLTAVPFNLNLVELAPASKA